MRTRETIIKDWARLEGLILEVLLDVRDLLEKKNVENVQENLPKVRRRVKG